MNATGKIAGLRRRVEADSGLVGPPVNQTGHGKPATGARLGTTPAIDNRHPAARLCALFAALMLSASPSAEEAAERPPLYRVEAIVFVHEQGRPDAFLEEALRSFDGLIDPLELAETERRTIEAAEESERLYPRGSAPERGRDMPQQPALPQPFLAVDEQSELMARAFRRLHDSPAYRPLARRVWYQPAERGTRTPGIRFHDGEVIREAQPEPEHSEAPIRITGDTWDRLRGEPETADRQAEVFYRLDGSLRLSQRQFLHLAVDLEWREPARPIAAGPEPSTPGSGSRNWSVHRLADSRVVRTGRLEYFDSPWLGVLVHLQRFEQPVIEAEPVLEPATIPTLENQGESRDD